MTCTRSTAGDAYDHVRSAPPWTMTALSSTVAGRSARPAPKVPMGLGAALRLLGIVTSGTSSGTGRLVGTTPPTCTSAGLGRFGGIGTTPPTGWAPEPKLE
jgi:hypothetical protein